MLIHQEDDWALATQIYKILVTYGGSPKGDQVEEIMKILKPGLEAYMDSPCYERGCPITSSDNLVKYGCL